MKFGKLTIIALLLGNAFSAQAEVHNQLDELVNASYRMDSAERLSAYKGWDYLVKRLKADGVTDREIKSVFQHPEMPEFGDIMFGLNPKESPRLYTGFTSASRVKAGKAFLEENKKYFEMAEKRFGVNRHVVASILLIETHFGKNTGNQLVINRLSRLAAIGEPGNLRKNYRKHLEENPKLKFEQVQNRARYLEERFYPQVLALFEIGRRQKIDVMQIKGSSAGAFGMPQFLPANYLKFGTDGNRDGKVSLFHSPDAILSTARFLANFKWSEKAPLKVKRQAIWNYNPSEPYIDTVLKVAEALRAPAAKPMKVASSKPLKKRT